MRINGVEIGAFLLWKRLLLKGSQMSLKLCHMRVRLKLWGLKMMLIMALAIMLIHFSAIKFIILNYNFSTASP
jgi:hypothetical protein